MLSFSLLFFYSHPFIFFSFTLPFVSFRLTCFFFMPCGLFFFPFFFHSVLRAFLFLFFFFFLRRFSFLPVLLSSFPTVFSSFLLFSFRPSLVLPDSYLVSLGFFSLFFLCSSCFVFLLFLFLFLLLSIMLSFSL